MVDGTKSRYVRDRDSGYPCSDDSGYLCSGDATVSVGVQDQDGLVVSQVKEIEPKRNS